MSFGGLGIVGPLELTVRELLVQEVSVQENNGEKNKFLVVQDLTVQLETDGALSVVIVVRLLIFYD